MTRTVRRIAAAAAACLLVMSLAVGWYVYTGRSSVQTSDRGLTIMVAERTQSSFMAGIHAKVTKVGRCVGLNRSLTIWPHGTRVTDDGVIVDGHRYRLGDSFTGGGGVLEQNSNDFNPGDVDAPAGCPVTDALILVSPT